MQTRRRPIILSAGIAWLSLTGCGGSNDDDISVAGGGGSSGSHAGSGAFGGTAGGGKGGQVGGGEGGQITAGEAGEANAGESGEAGATSVGGTGATGGGGGGTATGGTTGGGGVGAAGGSGLGGTTSAGSSGTNSGSGGSGIDACANVTCSGHGSCSLVGAVPSCVCSAGYAQADGDPTTCLDVDECASNHGGCDPRTSCTNLPGSRACGACPAGYAGTGETVCTPTACTGAPDPSCACLKVALTGDDALAAASGGLSPFASIGAALDFASSDVNAPHAVCVAEGSACGMYATYAGPNGADLAMHDGVSLYGNYESTTWSRCTDSGTTLAPGSANGVYFGPTLVSPTVLDGFVIGRFSAPSTAGVTLDGARGAVVSNVDVGTPVNGADTTYGVDAKNGADATLDGIEMRGIAPSSPQNQVGIRAVGAKLLVKNSAISLSYPYGAGSSLVGAWLENADGSALLDDAFTIGGNVATAAVHAANTSGLTLDGTRLTFNGSSAVTTAADFTAVSALRWRNGSISGAQAYTQRGISLVDSPGATLDVAVNIGSNSGTGIYLKGAADGTLLDGSVTSTRPLTGVSIDDCAGTAPLIRTTVNVPGTGIADAISVAGNCSPTISAKANLSVYISGAIYAPPGLQAFAAIHCRTPSQCKIDHSVATITGGVTPYLSFIQAYGVACDPGACPTVVDSTASGLSAVGEQHDASYTGGGILAPGATLVARNTARGLCSGRDGAGMRASGRIENNVIVGPSCGATFIDAVEKAVGLEVTGPSVVHSNSITGGGATDWGMYNGFNECHAAGVVDSGHDSFFNNDVAGGCGPGSALFVNGALDSVAFAHLMHNHFSGAVAYGDAWPYLASRALIPQGTLTPTAVNLLAGASGNFWSGSNVDAGTTLEAPLTDIAGVPRDASPDVGPYEATGAPTACLGVYCSDHGVCLVDHGAACVCDPGYSGSDCATVDPCTIANGGCDPLSACTLVGGNPSCGPCPSGYTGTGSSGCIDIDECQTDNGGCDPLTTCTNVPGGRTCGACPPEYAGNGETGCVPGVHCSPNPCSHDGTCVETGSSYSCDCKPGNAGPTCELTPTAVSLGYQDICSLLSDQSIGCWGPSVKPPAGSFTAVSSAGFFSCALTSNGEATCWGQNVPTPPTDTFRTITTGNGGSHVCGIHPDGTVVCWGSNFEGQANPPGGTFTALAANASTTCGIRTDASITCWGMASWGITTPPAGSFKAVSVGGTHACAIALDDSVVCWGGANAYGQATPPAGAFKELAAAGYYTCGIRADGSIACWGDDNGGRFTPPAGSGYHSLAAMFFETATPRRRACAVDAQGELACWGDPLN